MEQRHSLLPAEFAVSPSLMLKIVFIISIQSYGVLTTLYLLSCNENFRLEVRFLSVVLLQCLDFVFLSIKILTHPVMDPYVVYTKVHSIRFMLPCNICNICVICM